MFELLFAFFSSPSVRSLLLLCFTDKLCLSVPPKSLDSHDCLLHTACCSLHREAIEASPLWDPLHWDSSSFYYFLSLRVNSSNGNSEVRAAFLITGCTPRFSTPFFIDIDYFLSD
jgi:hypothetical protein